MQAMVFNDQEELDSQTVGHTLPSNLLMDEADEWEVN